jgi:hypothetical protein
VRDKPGPCGHVSNRHMHTPTHHPPVTTSFTIRSWHHERLEAQFLAVHTRTHDV